MSQLPQVEVVSYEHNGARYDPGVIPEQEAPYARQQHQHNREDIDRRKGQRDSNFTCC